MPNEPQNTRKASMWLAGKIGGGFSSVAVLGFVGASVWNQFFELKEQVASLQERVVVEELATETAKLNLSEVKLDLDEAQAKHDSEKKALWTDLARKNQKISDLESEAKLLQFIVTRTAASEWFEKTEDQSDTLSLGQGQGEAVEFEPLLAVPEIVGTPEPVDVAEYREGRIAEVPLSQQELQERQRIKMAREQIQQQQQQQQQKN